MTDVITKLAGQYTDDTAIRVRCNCASSSTLAKQLQAGATADIFISANVQWMDAIDRDGLIDSATRTDLLGNALVIIAPADAVFSLDLAAGRRLPDVIDGRIAMGDPDHVPAGRYAKQSLKNLGWWDELESRVVACVDVRSALAFVERGEVDAGIVYSTDARITDRVSVVARLPKASHDPIVYPAAALKNASDNGRRFLDYLHSDAAASVFRDAGFTVISSPP